jgi:hypothetical protein
MIKALVGVTIAALLAGYATAMQDPVQKKLATSTSLEVTRFARTLSAQASAHSASVPRG